MTSLHIVGDSLWGPDLDHYSCNDEPCGENRDVAPSTNAESTLNLEAIYTNEVELETAFANLSLIQAV